MAYKDGYPTIDAVTVFRRASMYVVEKRRRKVNECKQKLRTLANVQTLCMGKPRRPWTAGTAFSGRGDKESEEGMRRTKYISRERQCGAEDGDACRGWLQIWGGSWILGDDLHPNPTRDGTGCDPGTVRVRTYSRGTS